jgi:hypothetical protein
MADVHSLEDERSRRQLPPDTAVVQFPQTLAAAKKHDVSLWELGAALEKECPVGESGVDNQSGSKLTQCSEELKRHGLEYTPASLHRIRTISKAYPNATRVAPLSFAVHRAAGTPDMLEKIVARAAGEPLTEKRAKEIKAEIAPRPQGGRHKSKVSPEVSPDGVQGLITMDTFKLIRRCLDPRNRAKISDNVLQNAYDTWSRLQLVLVRRVNK